MTSGSSGSETPREEPVDSPRSSRRGSRSGDLASDLLTGLIALGIVVALLTLWFAPWPGPTVLASSFSQDRSRAQTAVATASGGPWNVEWAVGFLPSQAGLLPYNYTSIPSISVNCAYTSLVNGSRSVPGSADVSLGTSTSWVFVFGDGSSSYLVVTDVQGVETIVGRLAGYDCPFPSPAFGVVGSTVIGPEAAAETANAVGGRSFLNAHPGANATLLLNSPEFGYGGIGAQWTVVYSTCPPASPTPTNGSAFSAVVNATEGTVLAASNATVACPTLANVRPTPLMGVLAVHAGLEANATGVFWCNFTVAAVTDPVELGDLSFSIDTASGARVVPAPAGNVSIVAGTNRVLGVFDLESGTWSSGATQPLVPSDRISLRSTEDLSGRAEYFDIVGTGLYSGLVSLSIP